MSNISFGQKLYYGILGGFDLSMTHLTDKPSIYEDMKYSYPLPSFNIDLHVSYQFKSAWGFSIEPGFIRKGSMSKFDPGDKTTFISRNMNYLHIPILIDYHLSEKIFFSIGPEFSVLKNVVLNGNNSSIDATSSYNLFELSATAAINYSLLNFLDLGLRYNHGITSISSLTFTDNIGNIVSESKEYNHYLQFFVRLKLKGDA